jgi:hypothetical protein
MTDPKKMPDSQMPDSRMEGPLGEAGVPNVIARNATPDSTTDKDPNGEYENPAPLENRSRAPKPAHHDLQGNQGGQRGGSREPR